MPLKFSTENCSPSAPRPLLPGTWRVLHPPRHPGFAPAWRGVRAAAGNGQRDAVEGDRECVPSPPRSAAGGQAALGSGGTLILGKAGEGMDLAR